MNIITNLDNVDKTSSSKQEYTISKNESNISMKGSPLLDSDSNCTGIIRKVIHSRTEITIYPNGQMFLGKTQQWIEGQIYKPRPKKKKKVVPKTKITKKTQTKLEDTRVNQEEVY